MKFSATRNIFLVALYAIPSAVIGSGIRNAPGMPQPGDPGYIEPQQVGFSVSTGEAAPINKEGALSMLTEMEGMKAELDVMKTELKGIKLMINGLADP